MNTIKKVAILLAFLVAFSSFLYADTLYNISVSISRLYEHYPDEDYGRDLEGVSFEMTLNHFPGGGAFGWFLRTSIGSNISGFEWKGDQIESTYIYSSTDLRLSGGPSYRILAGSMIEIPISLGLSFSNYREETHYDYYSSYYGSTGFFESLNLGLLCDLSVVINYLNQFTIVNGLTINWDFLHWERGNATMNYRNINSGRLRWENYSAFKICYYFGIGWRFNSPTFSGNNNSTGNSRGNTSVGPINDPSAPQPGAT